MYRLIIATLLLFGVTLIGCGSDESGSEETSVEQMATAETGGDTSGTNLLEEASVQQLPSGVRFQDLREGEGEALREGDFVKYDYTVWFAAPDGVTKSRLFHSTSASEQPWYGQVGENTMEGLTHGLVGMREGGLRRIFIPSELGYPTNTPFGGKGLIFEIDSLRLATPQEVEEYQSTYNSPKNLREHGHMPGDSGEQSNE